MELARSTPHRLAPKRSQTAEAVAQTPEFEEACDLIAPPLGDGKGEYDEPCVYAQASNPQFCDEALGGGVRGCCNTDTMRGKRASATQQSRPSGLGVTAEPKTSKGKGVMSHTFSY